jgi:hypothetical protein
MKTETSSELRSHVFTLEMENRILEEANEKIQKRLVGATFAFILAVKHLADPDAVTNAETVETFCEICGFDQVTAHYVRERVRIYRRIIEMANAGAGEQALIEEMKRLEAESDSDDEGHSPQ